MRFLFVTLLFTVLLPASLSAQTSGHGYSGSGALSSAGIGKATSGIFSKLGTNLQRQSAKPAKPARKDPATAKTRNSRTKKTPPVVKRNIYKTEDVDVGDSFDDHTAKNYGVFRPDPNLDTTSILVDAMSLKPQDEQVVRAVVTAAKQAYAVEARKRGWQNNMAGALAFFVASNLTVYHDVAEPSEDAMQQLYNALNESIDESDDFSRTSDKDKQTIHDALIGFAALPLATYMEGKQTQNRQTQKTARLLAGEMIRSVMKMDPDSVKIVNGRFKVG